MVKKKIRGYELFEDESPNIGIIGKKRSGKTSVVFKILKERYGPNTKILIFTSTVYNDPGWIEITKYFEDKDIPIVTNISIYDEDDGHNLIESFTKNLALEAREILKSKKKGLGEQLKIISVDEPPQIGEGEKKEKKQKYLTPEWIVVFDDLSNELKDKSIEFLIKRNRHFKSNIIISTQSWIDIPPSSRTQLQYLLLFPSIPVDKLKDIYKNMNIAVSEEDFLTMYYSATKEQYNFLYVDPTMNKFRHNFDEEYNIE